MTTKTVWAAYFSATNTTKKVVTQIARRLSQQTACPMEIYDFTHPQARKTPKAFAPGDLVVFGTPVYAGRVPNLLIRFVAAVQGNGALAVPVACYGNRNYDDALMELRNTLEAGGFHTVAGGAFSCQHAFSLTQAAGRQRSHHCLGICRPNLPQSGGPYLPGKPFPGCREGQRPRGSLLHPPGPPRKPHQYPPCETQNHGRLYPVRPVRPGMSSGGH